MTLTCFTVHQAARQAYDANMLDCSPRQVYDANMLDCSPSRPDSHMTLKYLTAHPDSHMTLTRLTVDQAARQAYESVIFLELAEDRKSKTLRQFKELMVKASLQQYNYSYDSTEVRHSSHL